LTKGCRSVLRSILFFNEANLRYLERAIAEAKAGKNIEQHQLLDF